MFTPMVLLKTTVGVERVDKLVSKSTLLPNRMAAKWIELDDITIEVD